MQSSLTNGMSTKFLAAIAACVVAWSHVEVHLDLQVLSKVAMQGRGSGSMLEPQVAEVMSLPFGEKARRLSEVWPEARKLIREVLVARAKRDRLIALPLRPEFDDDVKNFKSSSAIALTSGLGGPSGWDATNQRTETVTIEELQQLLGEIEKLYWELIKLDLPGGAPPSA